MKELRFKIDSGETFVFKHPMLSGLIGSGDLDPAKAIRLSGVRVPRKLVLANVTIEIPETGAKLVMQNTDLSRIGIDGFDGVFFMSYCEIQAKKKGEADGESKTSGT